MGPGSNGFNMCLLMLSLYYKDVIHLIRLTIYFYVFKKVYFTRIITKEYIAFLFIYP